MKQAKGKKNKKEEIHSIKSSRFSRGLSVFSLTVSTSAKYFGMKAGELFLDEVAKGERFQGFLSDQVSKLVDEFGKLKGSFMKVGQMLSIYGEYYLPPEVNDILKQLQSESKPVSWAVMEKTIRKNLGAEAMDQLEINPESISAASMGQVYQAIRKSDGTVFALKVQYPGVDKAIDHDLQGIKSILSLSKIIPSKYEFDEIFEEVKIMLKKETDYNRELEQITKFQQLLGDDDRFVVPQVFPEFSNKRILCMSFEDGLAVDSDEVAELPQKNRNMIGAAVMDLLFREIFVWRLVQTDSHFGNFKIRPGKDDKKDRIVLFDFGAIRKFPKRYMEPFSQLVESALEKDADGVVKRGLQMGFLQEGDADDHVDLFVDLCFSALIAFEQKYASASLDGSTASGNEYKWGDTDLISELTDMAKNAIFAFRFRPPPRESVFLNRKILGTYFFLRRLNCEFGPRKLLKMRLSERKPS